MEELNQIFENFDPIDVSWFDYDEFVDFIDNEQINELTVAGRRKMARSAKRTAKRRARKRKLKEKRRKGKVELSKKAQKAAISKIRKKLIRGMKWKDMPFMQREKIDAKVKKKKKRIAQIAKQMMPQMQKAEKQRLARVRAKMTSNDPKKAIESLDLDFEIMLNEGMRAGTGRLANRSFSHATKQGSHGVGDRESEHHVAHSHDKDWEQSTDPWDHVIMVKDTQSNTYKLEVAHALNLGRHELVMGPSTKSDIPSKKMVRKNWATQFAQKALRANEADPHATGWEDTPTSRDLMSIVEPSSEQQPAQDTEEQPPVANAKEGEVSTEPQNSVDPEVAQAEKDASIAQNRLTAIQANSQADEIEAQQQAQAEQEEIRTFENHATAEQKKSKYGRQCKDCNHESWDHKPEDLEAGIVVAQNLLAGMSEEEAYSTLSEKAEKRLRASATALESAKRIQQTLINDLVEAYGGEAEDWVGEHSGTGITTPDGKKVPAKELLTNDWKNPKIGDQVLKDEGGTDATPKADLIIRNIKTGKVIPISLKTGDAQLMSGKAGESRATLAYALNKTKGDLHPTTVKNVEKLLKKMDGWITKAATPMGKPSQYAPALFIPGSKKKSFKSLEDALASAGNDKGKQREVRETYEQIQEMVDTHKEFNEELNKILSSAPNLRHAIIEEAMTGWGKYGKDSELSANYVLSSHADGTGGKLVEINDEYVSAVGSAQGTKYGVRTKSNQRTLKGKKSGSFSFYSAWSINVKAKDLSSFKSNLMAGFVPFGQFVLNEENDFQEMDEQGIWDFLQSNPAPEMSAREYMKGAKEWIGKDIGRLMQFMGVDVEGIDLSSKLTDIVQKGGDTNVVRMNGKKFSIPVDNADKENEMAGDGLDSHIKELESQEQEEPVNEDFKKLIESYSYEFKESSTHGMGSFATKDIQEDEMISLYYLNLIEDYPSYQRTDFCRLTNHSHLNENARLKNVDGNFVAFATRDIQEGEELFIDYFNVFDTILPELGEYGEVISEVLQWTDGYNHLRFGSDNFNDLRDELNYFIEQGDCPRIYLLDEDKGDASFTGNPKRAKYLKQYAAQPLQRKRRSARTNARNKLIRQGRASVGDGKDLDHKDGNPMNNSRKNLRLVSPEFNRGRDNNKWREKTEEHGAGEAGTKELLKKYLKDTPYMTINDKFTDEL